MEIEFKARRKFVVADGSKHIAIPPFILEAMNAENVKYGIVKPLDKNNLIIELVREEIHNE